MGRIKTRHLRQKQEKPTTTSDLLGDMVGLIEDQVIYKDVLVNTKDTKEEDLYSMLKRSKKARRMLKKNPNIHTELFEVASKAVELYLEDGHDEEKNVTGFVAMAIDKIKKTKQEEAAKNDEEDM